MSTKLLLSYLNNIQKGNQQFISFQNSIRKNSNLRPITILESPQGEPQWGSSQTQPPPGDLSNWTWITYGSGGSDLGGYWQYNGDPNSNHWQWNSIFGYWEIVINGVLYWSAGGNSPINQNENQSQQVPAPLVGWADYFTQQGLPEWPWWDFLSQLEDAFASWLTTSVVPNLPGPFLQGVGSIATFLASLFASDIAAFIIANNLGPAITGPAAGSVWLQLLNSFQPGSSSMGFGAWNNIRQIIGALSSGQSISSFFSGGAVNGVTMGALVRSLALAGLGIGSILSIIASWWHIYNTLQDPNWDSSTPPPISHKDIWNFIRQPVPQVDAPESLVPTPSVIPGGIPGVSQPPSTTTQSSDRLDLGGWFPGY
jgi:hypothetical protein